MKGLDETFFPAFLWPASTAHSQWMTVSGDLCQMVVLHSSHMGNPLSSLNLGPFNCVEFRLDDEGDHCRSYL